MPSLRGRRDTPREGAGQLPILLLDQGLLPDQLPVSRVSRQERIIAGSSAREGVFRLCSRS